MKSLKPFLFAVAGMVIAFLFAFKSGEPVKEYCKIQYGHGKLRTYYGDNVEKEIATNPSLSDRDAITLVNNMSKEGWTIISTEGNGGEIGFAIYLERIKK